MAKKIAIVNNKGGVGKTATAVNLSYALHLLGKQVLLIDLDGQASSTETLDGKRHEVEGTVYDSITPKKMQPCDVYEYVPGFDFVAGDARMDNIESALANHACIKEELVKRLVASMDSAYDYILLDCPPSLNLINRMALVAADSIIIPIDSSVESLKGLSKITNFYSEVVENGMNENLEIEGFLLTRYSENLSMSKMVRQSLRDKFADKVFNTRIHNSTNVGKAPGANETIFEFDPTNIGAEDYLQLAREISGSKKKPKPHLTSPKGRN